MQPNPQTIRYSGQWYISDFTGRKRKLVLYLIKQSPVATGNYRFQLNLSHETNTHFTAGLQSPGSWVLGLTGQSYMIRDVSA